MDKILYVLERISRVNNKIIFMTNPSEIVTEGKMTSDNVKLGSMSVIIDLRFDEGDFKPHFHVYVPDGKFTNNGRKKKTFHTCVRLDTADYFPHGPKQGKFSDDQKEDLNNILKSNYYKDPNHTVWESMVILWKDTHPKCKSLPKGLEMPDYTKLP